MSFTSFCMDLLAGFVTAAVTEIAKELAARWYWEMESKDGTYKWEPYSVSLLTSSIFERCF